MTANVKMKLLDISEIYGSLILLGSRDDLDDIWWDLGENANILKPFNKEYNDRKREIQNKFGMRDKDGKLAIIMRGNTERVDYGKNNEKADEVMQKLNESIKEVSLITIPITTLKVDGKADGKFKINIHPNIIMPLQGTIFVKDEEKAEEKDK